jgi:hypothetical protein
MKKLITYFNIINNIINKLLIISNHKANKKKIFKINKFKKYNNN